MALDRNVRPPKPSVELVKPKGKVPFFDKENAREMQSRSVESRKRNAREKAIATRADMQERLLPNVNAMIEDAVARRDQPAFWKIFEHAFGKAPESVEVHHEGDVTIVVRSAFQEQ